MSRRSRCSNRPTELGISRASAGTGAKKSAEPAKAGAPQNLSIAKLEIKDGKLAVGKANSTAKPQVYDKLNAEVTNFSSTSQFPFELTINLPGRRQCQRIGQGGTDQSAGRGQDSFRRDHEGEGHGHRSLRFRRSGERHWRLGGF